MLAVVLNARRRNQLIAAYGQEQLRRSAPLHRASRAAVANPQQAWDADPEAPRIYCDGLTFDDFVADLQLRADRTRGFTRGWQRKIALCHRVNRVLASLTR